MMELKVISKLLLILLALVFTNPLQLASAQSSGPIQNDNIIYMPVVATPPPRVSAYGFLTSNSCSGEYEGELMAALLDLSYGFKRLGYGLRVDGAVGVTWREEWTVDGQLADGLTATGVITENDELITQSIVFGGNGNCGDGVPRGQWIVRIYLDNTLYQEAVVTIR